MLTAEAVERIVLAEIRKQAGANRRPQTFADLAKIVGGRNGRALHLCINKLTGEGKIASRAKIAELEVPNA